MRSFDVDAGARLEPERREPMTAQPQERHEALIAELEVAERRFADVIGTVAPRGLRRRLQRFTRATARAETPTTFRRRLGNVGHQRRQRSSWNGDVRRDVEQCAAVVTP